MAGGAAPEMEIQGGALMEESDATIRDAASAGGESLRTVSLLIGFSVYLAYLDGTIVNVSLPAMMASFGATTAQISWVVLIYLLVQGSTLLFFGKIADLYGLKRTLIGGLAVFTIGSALCGLSPTLMLLIIARFLQGVGGAMLIVSAFAMVPAYFPKHLTGAAFGIITTSAALGTTTGAPLGGFITTWLSWPAIFFVNVPLGIAALLIAQKNIPSDTTAGEEPARLDVGGVVLSFSMVFCLLFAVNMRDAWGWRSPGIMIPAALFCLLLPLFIWFERRTPAPLINLQVFREPVFVLSLTSGAIAYAFLAGTIFLMPFYLSDIKHFSADKIGLLLLCYSIPLMLIGPVAGRINSKWFCIMGMSLAAASCFAFLFFMPTPGPWAPGIFLLINGLAFGLFNAPNNDRIKNAINREFQGSIFSLVQTFVRSSMALGVAFFSAVYAFVLPGAMPHSTPAELLVWQELSLRGYRASFLIFGIFCLISLALNILVLRYQSKSGKG